MNKKVIITIIAVILIIVLAIIVGKNLGKDNTEPANTNPVGNSTASPEVGDVTPTPETASPEPTETPSAEPTQNPTQTIDTSKMNTKQKEEYAKNIAKKEWEKLGVNTKVYYSYAYIDNKGRYVIAVREEATTNELMWYQIDIKTGTCEKLN